VGVGLGQQKGSFNPAPPPPPPHSSLAALSAAAVATREVERLTTELKMLQGVAAEQRRQLDEWAARASAADATFHQAAGGAQPADPAVRAGTAVLENAARAWLEDGGRMLLGEVHTLRSGIAHLERTHAAMRQDAAACVERVAAAARAAEASRHQHRELQAETAALRAAVAQHRVEVVEAEGKAAELQMALTAAQAELLVCKGAGLCNGDWR
jgi:hypothetical protein